MTETTRPSNPQEDSYTIGVLQKKLAASLARQRELKRLVDRSVPQALIEALFSANECDRNLEPANVVDGLFAIARSILRLAEAIDGDAGPGERKGGRKKLLEQTSFLDGDKTK